MKDAIPSDVDVVIHADDFTRRGEEKELEEFMKQFSGLSSLLKLFIAGNHELSLAFFLTIVNIIKVTFDAGSDSPENYYNKCINVVQSSHPSSVNSVQLPRYLLDEEVIICSLLTK
jgi:3',5'-cyclic AMP phosphodiesterase CpdA